MGKSNVNEVEGGAGKKAAKKKSGLTYNQWKSWAIYLGIAAALELLVIIAMAVKFS